MAARKKATKKKATKKVAKKKVAKKKVAKKKVAKKKATKKKATKKKVVKKKATKKKVAKKKATKKKATKKKAAKKKATRKPARRASGSSKKLEAVYVGMDHPLAMANGCTYRHRLTAWEKGTLKNANHVVSLETGKVHKSIRDMHADHRKIRERKRNR
jgi:hypothetical protein